MNKQKFAQILSSHEAIQEEDLIEISELGQDYPYSQVLHSISAIGTFKFKTKDAKKKLNIAAVYATDRSVLKEVILNLDTLEKTPPVKTAVAKDSPRETKKSTPSPREPKKEKQPEKIPPLEKASKAVVDQPTGRPGHLSADDAEQLRQDVLKNLEELMVIKSKFLEGKIDEKKPTSTARKSAKSRTKSTSKKRSGKGTKSSTKASTKSDSKTPSKTRSKTTSKPKKKEQPVAKKEKTQEKNLRKSYVANKAAPKPEVPDKSKTKTKTKKASKISKKEQSEIIQKFISEDPKIKQNKGIEETNIQNDLSIPSVEFGEDLISENLAKIMVKQGKKNKAIDIYKKLIWKYPQKKAYFASQIESIKK